MISKKPVHCDGLFSWWVRQAVGHNSLEVTGFYANDRVPITEETSKRKCGPKGNDHAFAKVTE